MRELLILRHGKSDWGASHARDFDRPLARRGRKAARRIAGWILAQDLVPDHVSCSPAVRARATLDIVAERLELPRCAIRWAPEIYEAQATALLRVLAGAPAASRCLMLVGHNPGLEDLVAYLTGASSGGAMPTAALAYLETEREWAALDAGCARLVAIVRPRELEGG